MQPNDIKPFAGLTANPEQAADVIAPPYDVLSRQETAEYAQDNPLSFLHISRPEIDCDSNCDPYDKQVYLKGKENFNQWIQQGHLLQDEQAAFYLYQMKSPSHEQLGVVCLVSTESYQKNRLKKHELTRPTKELDRINHIAHLQAQTGPVILSYRQRPALQNLLERLSQTSVPFLHDIALDDVEHSLWRITDVDIMKTLHQQLCQLDSLYIADGHHRCAAAYQVAQQQNKADYILSVLFPDDAVRILPYHRVIKTLGDYDAPGFLARLAKDFDVTPQSTPVSPTQALHFGLYLEKQWYQLVLKQAPSAGDSLGEQLDVSLLSQYILKPLLGIEDVRTDNRIDFVGGSRGTAGLVDRVDNGDCVAAFSLMATPLPALFAIADADEVMPPKSTWFEPKLADGLISYGLDWDLQPF